MSLKVSWLQNAVRKSSQTFGEARFFCPFRSSNPPGKPQGLCDELMNTNVSCIQTHLFHQKIARNIPDQKKVKPLPIWSFNRHSSISFLGEGDGESVNPEKRRVSVSVLFLVLLEVLFKKSSANLIW